MIISYREKPFHGTSAYVLLSFLPHLPFLQSHFFQEKQMSLLVCTDVESFPGYNNDHHPLPVCCSNYRIASHPILIEKELSQAFFRAFILTFPPALIFLPDQFYNCWKVSFFGFSVDNFLL